MKSVSQNSFSELFGGLYSGSLAILTDAAHLLTDMSSFIISLVAIHLSERPGMFIKRILYYWLVDSDQSVDVSDGMLTWRYFKQIVF